MQYVLYILYVVAIFPIVFYNHCPLNYLYLNLQSPFRCQPLSICCDGNEIKFNTMDGSGRVARRAKKECISLASAQTCNESAGLIGSCVRVATPSVRVRVATCHLLNRVTAMLFSQNITIILSSSPLLCLIFMTLFRNIQDSRTYQGTRTKNYISRTFRRSIATWPRQSPVTPTSLRATLLAGNLLKVHFKITPKVSLTA